MFIEELSRQKNSSLYEEEKNHRHDLMSAAIVGESRLFIECRYDSYMYLGNTLTPGYMKNLSCVIFCDFFWNMNLLYLAYGGKEKTNTS